jgi:hypothetical protein
MIRVGTADGDVRHRDNWGTLASHAFSAPTRRHDGNSGGKRMLRRFIIAGLAAAVAAPLSIVPPAQAVIIGSCTTVSGTATISPGLGHNQTAQSVASSASFSGCSQTAGGGPTGGTSVTGAGSFPGATATTSFPSRPLGCPTALGGAGPDYADQTPILISGDPGFQISWNDATTSTGIVKSKSNGPANPGKVRVVLVITAGHYAPPAGQKSKSKGILNFTPTDTFTCVDDSDRISSVAIDNVGNGSFILQQK